jgi:hypothetical protein
MLTDCGLTMPSVPVFGCEPRSMLGAGNPQSFLRRPDSRDKISAPLERRWTADAEDQRNSPMINGLPLFEETIACRI